jgi:hypothetical protein
MAERGQTKSKRAAWLAEASSRVERLTDTQIAYLAGLIDGEGSLECQPQVQNRGRTPTFSLRLSFTMGTDEPLQTVAGWLGMEMRTLPAVDEKRQARRYLHVKKGLAVPLLRRCLPYLILKADQATLMLMIEDARARWSPYCPKRGFPEAGVIEMRGLHEQLRALKSNKRKEVV